MTKRASLLLLWAAVGCSDQDTARTDITLHKLENATGPLFREISRSHGTAGGTMSEPERPPDDGLIMEDPGMGECAFLEYREEHTVVVDSAGNIVSETWSYCTRCLDAEGNTVGEEECISDPVLPPDVICYDYSDGYAYCYECVAPDGTVVDGACYPIDEPPPPPDDCLARLCEADPFCCEGGWDETCDAELGMCDVPPPPEPTPGCCESLVCERDPYCCEVAWDCRCDAIAAEVCGDTGGGGMEPPPPDPGEECFTRFCEVAPTCCEMIWDETCDATFLEICGPDGGGGTGGDPGVM